MRAHSGEFGRSGEPIDRRHAKADHLAVIGERLDDAQPLVDVVERGDAPHPLAQILLARRRLQQQFIDAAGKEMIEGIDVAHVLFSDLLAAAPMRENPTMRLCCKFARLYT